MEPNEFTDPSGELIKVVNRDKQYYSFVPNKLPITLLYDDELSNLISAANFEIGRLSGIESYLKRLVGTNVYSFIRPYMQNEAVISSRIEGTVSSLSDVFKEGAGISDPSTRKLQDLREVLNYFSAMEEGMRLVRDGEINTGAITGLQRILLQGVRGSEREIGTLRSRQNWIANSPTLGVEFARYVPPPADKVAELVGNILDYMANDKTPPLIKIALMHYQFEAVHPFADGNGRVGRLLIMLYLMKFKMMNAPLLYMSEYFDRNKRRYYDLLLEVSKKGDYLQWVKFFLNGVVEQSRLIEGRSESLLNYYETLGKEVKEELGAKSFDLFEMLFSNPFINIVDVTKTMGITYPTAKKSVYKLVEKGILKEVSYGPRSKYFVAEYINHIYSGQM